VAEPHTTAEAAKLLAGSDLAIVLHEGAETALTGLTALTALTGLRSAELPIAELPMADRPMAAVPMANRPTAAVPPAGEIVLVVGPEGGIGPDELDRFAEAGAVRCRLGPTVLRTSTAGTVAAALLLARVGRWS
jgi:16S rRNA (uracil1498-N3)-methyltransferase